MMAWCSRSTSTWPALRWTSSTFPTTRGPRAGTQPVLALGNFDGVHRGHRKILDRVRRVAAERGATPVVMTFDPHPPRVVRPDKAPPLLMTTAQKLEALARRRRAGRRHRPLHAGAVALGSGDVRARPCWSTGCASPRSGSARTFCSATTAPATSRCCATLGAPLRLQGREDRSGPLQGLRRQQHAHPAAGRRGARGRGRRAARPPVLHRRHGRARRPARAATHRLSDRESVHRQRAAAAARRLRDDGDASAGSCTPSVTNIGARPTVDAVGPHGGRDAHLRPRPRSVRPAAPRRLRAAAARRARVRVAGRAARPDRRRLPARARCCSTAFHCRISPRGRSGLLLRARRVRRSGLRPDGDRGRPHACCGHVGYAGSAHRRPGRRAERGAGRAGRRRQAALRGPLPRRRRAAGDRRRRRRPRRLAHGLAAARRPDPSCASTTP